MRRELNLMQRNPDILENGLEVARHARPWQVGPGRGEKRLAVCSGAEWVGISGQRPRQQGQEHGGGLIGGEGAGTGTGTGTGCCVLLPLLVGVSLPRSLLRPPCVPPHYSPGHGHHTPPSASAELA
jgi:hypothetical protein